MWESPGVAVSEMVVVAGAEHHGARLGCDAFSPNLPGAALHHHTTLSVRSSGFLGSRRSRQTGRQAGRQAGRCAEWSAGHVLFSIPSQGVGASSPFMVFFSLESREVRRPLMQISPRGLNS
ncbi:hypothetical protein Pcinc_021743 [Petrolisthes cinctipes]|uniref:Uncharacterized protein n=1 Tax=Petrolisthes cinctipes TaxID=88211 RepID=A0AAE1FHF0_PETCI|nr:hypothetical protein Pcinc_021743 [Petrolisthes cinctipes]